VGHVTKGVDAESLAGYTLLLNEPVIVEDLRDERRFHIPPSFMTIASSAV
jgi:hypothetical protein